MNYKEREAHRVFFFFSQWVASAYGWLVKDPLHTHGAQNGRLINVATPQRLVKG